MIALNYVHVKTMFLTYKQSKERTSLTTRFLHTKISQNAKPPKFDQINITLTIQNVVMIIHECIGMY